jgi:hypothetical protein
VSFGIIVYPTILDVNLTDRLDFRGPPAGALHEL